MGRYTYHTFFLGLFTFVTCMFLRTCRQVTDIEVLQRTTCERVYKIAQGNRKNINFSHPIGNLYCKPGPKGFIRYHCMENEDGIHIQFCAEWIWIEPEFCPKLFSFEGIINPVECNKPQTCPNDRYQSHEYYKYPACFNITKLKVNQGATDKEENSLASTDQKNGNNIPSAIGISVGVIEFLILIGVGIALILILRKRRKQNKTVKRAHPLGVAKHHLDDGKCILITGKKGEGVSTFIPSLHGAHYSSYKLKKVDYSFDRINESKQFFIMSNSNNLDDNEFDGLFNLINRQDRQTKIVIDVTRSRYVELKQRFDQACPDLVAGMDLSSDDLKMTSQERKELITIFCKKSGISKNELFDQHHSQITILIEFESSEYGFSHVCEWFFDTSRGELINRLTNVGGALERALERSTERNTMEPRDESGVHIELLRNGEAN